MRVMLRSVGLGIVLLAMALWGTGCAFQSLLSGVEVRPDVDQRVVASELRHLIEAALAEAGIAIAFPQRDLHLDAARPLPVQLVAPAGAEHAG